MCGIIGSITMATGFDASVGINKLAHRGPDASGVFYSSNKEVFLGQTRLSIVDLSDAANQPFHSEDGRYTMVYNGELYNHRELANKHALSLRTSSDTEVLLNLYIKLGEAFLSELNGMFAAAIYDSLTNKLFLCRDRLGIKPLYYFKDEQSLAFASELPALKALVPTQQIDQESAAQFLHRGYIAEPKTLYHKTFKFPSGAFATYADGKLDIKHFWKPEDSITAHTHSDEFKTIKTLEALLRDSVSLRLMADVPYGTFLSGGTDSGLITALAADLSSEPLNTFNVSFEDTAFDETPFAVAMAKTIGAKHHHIKVTKKEVMENLHTGFNLVGEPFADSSVFPTMAISKFAAQHVKMVLCGDGGDELFLGYGAYNWAERMSNPIFWNGRKAIATALRIKGGARNRRAANVFDIPNKASFHHHIFSQEQNLFTEKEASEIMGFKWNDNWQMPNSKRKLSTKETQAFFDLTNYLKDDLLVKVDRSSMRQSLEARVPFLDHRMVEFALNIDPKLKTKNGETKYLLKKIMERYYPKDLIYRQKWGFSIPLEKWMKNSPNLLQSNTSSQYYGTFETIKRNYNADGDSQFLYNRLYTLRSLTNYENI